MKSSSLEIGKFMFLWGSRTYVMGILNVTPDSFSGDGLLAKENVIELAIQQAGDFIANGADILDVGGESTRPASAPVQMNEEIARVIPVIHALHKKFPDVLISIDTYKSQVAEEAIKAGAHIVNDVWGLRADPQLADVVAKHKVPVILMHNRSNPASVDVREKLGNAYIGSEYQDLIKDVKRELLESVDLAKKAGIDESHILLDPGIGFGKTREHNLELINRLDEIRALGYPTLLGTSRKSFIGFTLDLPPEQRMEGTAATVAVGIVRGADVIRVHDVTEMARVAKMTDAVVRKMIETYSRDLLRSGILEAKAGQRESALRYLDRAIYMSGESDVLAEAWFWMGEMQTDPIEKRKAYQNCLSHELHHTRARRALAMLDGTLKADDLIDPNHLPVALAGARDADAKRFMCPKCGGRMAFAPDGRGLVCEYCSRNQTLSSGAADEKDFVVAMATLKGHGRPLQEQVFHCKGCGAEFILPPRQLSASCVYCDSPYVVSLEKTKDLLAPDGIIPHAFDQKKAVQLLIEWVEANKIKPEKKVDLPRGLYLPLWTFDIGGVIDYTAEIIEQDETSFIAGKRQLKVTRVNDQYPVLVDDLPLPASRKPSAVFLRLIPTFQLRALKPYDPRFLASWPAEIYDVPMADASLDARSQTYLRYKKELPYTLGNIHLVHTSSANLMVESFKLNLLPVWMTEIPFDGREHLVLINGQSGVVASDISEHAANSKDGKEKKESLLDFLADLLTD